MDYTLAEYLSFFIATRYNRADDGVRYFSYNALNLVDQIPFAALFDLIANRVTMVGTTQFTLIQVIFPKDEQGAEIDFSELDPIQLGTRIKQHLDRPELGDGDLPPTKKNDDDDIDSVRELWGPK